MKNVKIVIGANFGDEGKGLATDYFSYNAINDNQSCIVVCCNGGAQKGHTITTPDGLRHVTHHFGSGILAGADTYLSEDFIINPILFRMEREELISKGITPAKIYVNSNCMITTPYDMLINQIQEEARGDNKHGSCGVGIFETIQRYNKDYFLAYCTRIGNINMTKFKKDMFNMQRYTFIKLRMLKLDISDKNRDIINSDILIENFYDDMEYFFKNVVIVYDEATTILNHYDTVIFECSQGLLLDQNNTDYFPHLTPSNTGLTNPMKVIKNYGANVDIEICYITRTYVTRHGAGMFINECDKSDIGSNINDLTNVPNPFQDTIRYGKLDINLLLSTISKDISNNIPEDINYKVSLMVTHINETNDYVIEIDRRTKILKFFILMNNMFDRVYRSNGMTRNDIK